MANAIVRYSKEPKKNSWCRWMVGRTMRNNNSNLIAVVGKTGSGKTHSTISICEMMSKLDKVPFTIDHIVFTLKDLMDLINDVKLKRGTKIVWDEPQVSISARDFQSKANKVINYLLTTFRHKNFSLFFCTPFESLLDKSSRKLFHARFETMSINKNKRTCRLKPRYIEYSDHKAEAYRKQLIVLYKLNGKYKSNKLSYWDVPAPSKEMVEQYEDKKLKFTTNLNKNILQSLEQYDKSGKNFGAEREEPKVERKPLTPKQEEVMKVLSKHNFPEAKEILGKSMSAIFNHKKYAMKKGYTLEEFKEDG